MSLFFDKEKVTRLINEIPVCDSAKDKIRQIVEEVSGVNLGYVLVDGQIRQIHDQKCLVFYDSSSKKFRNYRLENACLGTYEDEKLKSFRIVGDIKDFFKK